MRFDRQAFALNAKANARLNRSSHVSTRPRLDHTMIDRAGHKQVHIGFEARISFDVLFTHCDSPSGQCHSVPIKRLRRSYAALPVVPRSLTLLM